MKQIYLWFSGEIFKKMNSTTFFSSFECLLYLLLKIYPTLPMYGNEFDKAISTYVPIYVHK